MNRRIAHREFRRFYWLQIRVVLRDFMKIIAMKARGVFSLFQKMAILGA